MPERVEVERREASGSGSTLEAEVGATTDGEGDDAEPDRDEDAEIPGNEKPGGGAEDPVALGEAGDVEAPPDVADALPDMFPPSPPGTFSGPPEPGFIATAALIDGASSRPVLAPPAQISRVYCDQRPISRARDPGSGVRRAWRGSFGWLIVVRPSPGHCLQLAIPRYHERWGSYSLAYTYPILHSFLRSS